MNHPEPPTLHYTELPPRGPNDPLEVEWNTYRREVARLLAEGQEGRHVLIKGEEIVGFYDTRDDALAVAYRRFRGQPFFIRPMPMRISAAPSSCAEARARPGSAGRRDRTRSVGTLVW